MKNLYKIENELYIVDNTEEINKDTKTCWCIDISCNELVLHQGALPSYHYKHYKKIIMTTDKSINVLCSCGKDCGAKENGVQTIDEEFLDWFVNNPDCEWVDVDTRPKVSSPYEKGFVIDNPNYNKITISKEEVKESVTVDVPFGMKYIRFENLTSEQAGYLIQISEFYQLNSTRITAVIPKEEQKQHLIDIMKGDEELELYDEPNKTHYLDELPNMNRDVLAKMWESAIPKLSTKQETVEEAAKRLWLDPTSQLTSKKSFIQGAKWQQEKTKKTIFDKVDYKLLAKQKMLLIKLNNTNNIDGLDGLIHFLDAFQDEAVDMHGKSETEVFSLEGENNETLEEAALRLYPKYSSDPYNPTEDVLEEERNIFIAGGRYQSEKMYSETEVLQLLLKLQQTDSYDNLYDWFEQVKKK